MTDSIVQRIVEKLYGERATTDAEKWAKIRDAWLLYCAEGTSAFDWDYDSRDIMRELTEHSPGEWLTTSS